MVYVLDIYDTKDILRSTSQDVLRCASTLPRFIVQNALQKQKRVANFDFLKRELNRHNNRSNVYVSRRHALLSQHFKCYNHTHRFLRIVQTEIAQQNRMTVNEKSYSNAVRGPFIIDVL